jgi:site-specific DNA recombinase
MGRVGRAKSGLYSGNERVTTGYDYVDGKLVVNEYYAEIVRRIFKEFNAGRPLKAIARDLNAEGIRTSQGYDFIGGNIRRILTHRTYIGEIEHLGVVYKGQHEAIIDRESFERAQKRLEDRKKNDEIYLNFSHRASFLTGLCWCIHCQSKKEVISASRNKDGFRPRYIGCREKKKKNCPDKRIHIEIVENFVIKQIRNLTLDPEFLKTIRSKSDTLPIKEQIEHLESQIAENEKKIERLTDLYMIGSMDFNTIRERIEKINHAIMLHRERIKRLKDSTPIEKADEEILRLASLIDSQDEELIKIAVSSLIKRVDFDGPLISIQWNL